MLHLIISGFVQGVGFRQYIKQQARDLNLKGWVKNTFNGKVEAVFVGDSLDTEKMLEICKKGPFLAEVKKVEVKNIPDQSFESFEIIK